jgi:carbonic anhydrase
MKKISEQGMTSGHYTAEACILYCYDNRCFTAFLALLKKDNIKSFDPIFIAGGANDLSNPEKRAEILNQIKTSIRLHHTKRVIIMMHRDCGACGGSKAFDNNNEKEIGAIEQKLRAGKEFLEKNLSGVPIELIFVDYDGVYRVD